ncbi:MAG: MBL fold metallo-hydrolase [Planctomycetota bacterium]
MTELLTYDEDLFLPPLGLWLDPGRIKDLAFISHAHADHTGRHKSIIATPPTARMIEHRLQVQVDRIVDFGTPFPVGEGQVTLYPSGHILGAAQALVEWHNERLLYTGDFKIIPSRTAEPCQVVECDHLIMECTYGRPHYRFPNRDSVERELMSYIEKVLERKEVPIILAYVLGRSQELLKLLTENGIPVAVENRIYDMSKIYEEEGVSFGSYERFDPNDYHDRVLLFPPHLWKSPVVRNIRDRRTIAVTGWAIDGRQQAWYSTDEAFPLSDHADFEDLLRYIEMAKASKVSLIHGFQEFADHLQNIGIETHIIADLLT